MGGMGARSIQGSGDETVADRRSGKANSVPVVALSWCIDRPGSLPTRPDPVQMDGLQKSRNHLSFKTTLGCLAFGGFADCCFQWPECSACPCKFSGATP